VYAPLAGDGPSGTYEWDSREGDDFVQAGALYRVMDEAARARLVANIADSLAQVSKDEIIERSVAHFRAADAEYGERIAAVVAQLRGNRRSEASRRTSDLSALWFGVIALDASGARLGNIAGRRSP